MLKNRKQYGNILWELIFADKHFHGREREEAHGKQDRVFCEFE